MCSAYSLKRRGSSATATASRVTATLYDELSHCPHVMKNRYSGTDTDLLTSRGCTGQLLLGINPLNESGTLRTERADYKTPALTTMNVVHRRSHEVPLMPRTFTVVRLRGTFISRRCSLQSEDKRITELVVSRLATTLALVHVDALSLCTNCY